jgi:hypothetical protein
MMRHLISSQLTDFAAIYEADIELISVERPRDDLRLLEAANAALSRNNFKAQWSQRVDDGEKACEALAHRLGENAGKALADEINLAADMLGCLLECESVGIRIATLYAPMCPRFHVDRVPCRLLFTLCGAGTEWIAHDNLDRAVFADRESTREPLKPGASISQLTTGYWSLLKGGAWTEEFDGVVHRSPRDDNARLLVSVDPLFEGA